mgnify:CR=1 FL=1
MRQLAALILGIALLGGGCAWRAETRPTSFAERFSVSLGERIDVGDEPLSIGFKSVVQDSRCASDVVCIRAGEAVVQMTLSRPDQQEQKLTLATPPSSLQEHPVIRVIEGYRIELLGLEPYPRSNESMSERNYRATLIITKAS